VKVKISRAIKSQIRQWVAAEVRGRIAEGPPEDESDELTGAWTAYCREIADQISPRRVVSPTQQGEGK
jgi:hypothetical protein